MDSDMAAYKNDFLQEVFECLEIFNQAFVDLENGEDAAIDEIFRIAHTIKGMAGFLGYKSLENLCHNMEEVLCGIKNGDIEIEGELVDIMLSAVDRITEIVKQIEMHDSDNVDLDDILEGFENYKQTREREPGELCIKEPRKNMVPASETISRETAPNEAVPEEALSDEALSDEALSDEALSDEALSDEALSEEAVPEGDAPLNSYNLVLDINLSQDCMMKDLKASLITESLKDICRVIKTNPDEEEMNNNFNGAFTVFLSGDQEKVEALMNRISEIQYFKISSNNSQLNKVQRLKEKTAKIPDQKQKAKKTLEAGDLETCPASFAKEYEKYEKIPSESKRQETIRVRTSNLDNIMNLVGELVINKGRLLQLSQKYELPELEESTATLDKSISSLQDEVMRIRMVKIERVFSKFPRMVRDLSRKLGKNINFDIEGQDTELDRTILDEINDPLVHLVRNAVDHGIELPEERQKAGKSEIGNIKLSARREKNNVIIEIEDDGKGMDLELIKKKALEKGIISSFDIENLSEDEIRMLIFIPGFSTKEIATEISGRGVGMDAVKIAVEKLGGKVRVYSKKGEYTKIRIDLPPTVAIIKSLLVELGSEIYAIPISNVVKALSIDSSDYRFVKETPLLYIREKLIPVIKLKEIFNIQCEKLDTELAIIVEKENEEVGLIVDSIIDQQEIVIKPLVDIFSTLKGFIGVTILGDGRVIPILDVSLLIRGDFND